MELDPAYGRKLGVSLVPLDFVKLKSFFKNQIQNEIQICATLQALRWRLTRVGAAMRKQIMLSYIHYDLLESGEILSEQNSTVIETLFFSDSLKIREYLIAFINSMASEYLGRTYLIQKKNIVHLLVETLYSEGNQDSYLRQNALGALQKFSLRRHA